MKGFRNLTIFAVLLVVFDLFAPIVDIKITRTSLAGAYSLCDTARSKAGPCEWAPDIHLLVLLLAALVFLIAIVWLIVSKTLAARAASKRSAMEQAT